jgi:hypothetical protein
VAECGCRCGSGGGWLNGREWIVSLGRQATRAEGRMTAGFLSAAVPLCFPQQPLQHASLPAAPTPGPLPSTHPSNHQTSGPPTVVLVALVLC